MPTVRGIFENRKPAEDVVLALVEAGFERYDARVLDDVSGLIEQGLMEDEAECYAQGLRRGGIVVALRCFPEGVGRGSEVMKKLGAVDVSARPAPHKAAEKIRPFGEMLEGSTRPMRAGETEAERREERSDRSEERRGQIDPVYGGGIGQKGEETAPNRDDQDQSQRGFNTKAPRH